MLQYLLLLLAITAPDTTNGILQIEIKGIKEIKGSLQIGLYNKAEGFAQKENVYTGRIVAVNNNTITVEIQALPHGTYAVSAFHDKNNNGKLDTNLFGVPVEEYGFSNNARDLLGPPPFDAAKFDFTNAKKKISIELK